MEAKNHKERDTHHTHKISLFIIVGVNNLFTTKILTLFELSHIKVIQHMFSFQ